MDTGRAGCGVNRTSGSEGGARKRTASGDPYRASLRPYWNLLEGQFELLLVNAQHIKAVPGRKTDIKDAEWIADLLQHGLLRPSFVPPAPQRHLRELTRYRSTLLAERARLRSEEHTSELQSLRTISYAVFCL